jgi:hypothetical protein
LPAVTSWHREHDLEFGSLHPSTPVRLQE